jgi:hypothetical protein
MGWFLMATSLLVATSVAFQLRAREQTLRGAAGYLVVAAGIMSTGIAQTFLSGNSQWRISVGGVALVVIGLIVARRSARSVPDRG